MEEYRESELVLMAEDGTLCRIDLGCLARFRTLRSGQERRCSRRAGAARSPANVLLADWDGRFYLVPRSQFGFPARQRGQPPPGHTAAP